MEQYQHLFNLNKRMYDSTVIQDYLKCPKLFEYRWVRRIALKEKKIALVFGSLFHSALLIWYTTHDLKKACLVFDELPKFASDETRTRERAIWLMEGYVERWKEEPYTIKELEISFHLAMPGGSIFAGRIDALVEWVRGIYVKDHKTARTLGLSFFRGFRPNFQIDGYCYACKELMGSCTGAIINGIQVCKTKRAYEKSISARTRHELEEFPRQYEVIIKEIEGCILNRNFHKNTTHCATYGGCPYSELCTYGDTQLSGKFKVEKVKELENGCTVVEEEEVE